jgi:hypothetical protein
VDPMTDNGPPGPTAPDTIVLGHGLWAITPGMTSTMTIAANSRETVRLTYSPFRLLASGHDATESEAPGIYGIGTIQGVPRARLSRKLEFRFTGFYELVLDGGIGRLLPSNNSKLRQR